jgi:nucleotide-binding universal stress UspA family protein
MKPIERILLATDLSETAAAAAAAAVQLARQLNASVDVLTVVDTSPLGTAYGDAAYRRQRIDEIHAEACKEVEVFARAHCGGAPEVRTHVRDGTTFLEILQAARDLESQLIVLGTHGRTGLAHLVLGSVAEKVVRYSTIPVLMVRAPA